MLRADASGSSLRVLLLSAAGVALNPEILAHSSHKVYSQRAGFTMPEAADLPELVLGLRAGTPQYTRGACRPIAW